jgi:uncharacterized protein (DUF1697 family)
MVDLAALLEDAGCRDVSWYLQTGNMFFDATGSRNAIATRIERRLMAHGMQKCDVMLRTAAQLQELVARDPFAAYDNETFHFSVSFLRNKPTATPTDKLERHGAVLCHLDDTVACTAVPRAGQLTGGVSTVIDKPWGTPTTTRWWHVVCDIAARVAT